MLNENERKLGIIEIGEDESRNCTECGRPLWVYDSWAIHRENDYFTYMRCLTCGTVFKVLEPIGDNTFFMGDIPTNVKGD